MQEYILRSWSLVKLGTTAAQKKLFFNLRKAKNRILAANEGNISDANYDLIAKDLNVDVADVKMMNQRMSGADQSLNSFTNDEENGEWIDFLEDGRDNQEILLGETQELDERKEKLYLAMESLTEREREIISQRQLAENPQTLEELSQVYGVSRERIRQIESRALEKLQHSMVAQ
jgi:RNA polymerase sigma-32 factor